MKAISVWKVFKINLLTFYQTNLQVLAKKKPSWELDTLFYQSNLLLTTNRLTISIS